MQRIALFPGTFDPVTIGHVDIVQRIVNMFDKVFVGIGTNFNKTAMYSDTQRVEWINEIFKNDPRIEGIVYEGLTVECCKQVGARYIVRGIRFVSDFEYEKTIADMNRSLDSGIETIFLTCLPQYSSVASTLVRDVIRNGGDASMFLPDIVKKAIYKTTF
ncbi:MAG: pantetheine-phosphate adenylyltransferase [Chitinophagaceae bacterium]|jgi:pantetheine-phosphate adenylyltransferase|nr:pantetheine-phosphate adenylyltransferase [Chitinophagaceae bacterium]